MNFLAQVKLLILYINTNIFIELKHALKGLAVGMYAAAGVIIKYF